jgi:hypothetical protein
MRNLLLALGAFATLAGATAVPTMASAYVTRCEANAHNKKVEGTIAGGALGALAGGLIGHSGVAAAVGGVAGAAIGNNLSRTHCDHGQVARVYDERYYDPDAGRYRPGYGPGSCQWRQESYRDDRGYRSSRYVQVCR